MQVEQLQFKIDGMDCAEEVAVLKKELGPIVGGEDRLSFDLLNAKLTISIGSVAVTPEAILVAVARTGMKAEVWRDGPKPAAKESFFQRWGRTLLTAVSGLFTVAGFVTHAAIAGSIQEAIGSEGMGLTRHVPLAVQALYGLGILAGAWFVLPRAWLSLRRLRPDMNLLMTVAVVGAAGLGDWFEASTVAFLFSVSLLLEKWSVGHARRAVETLLDLTPPMARLLLPDGSQAGGFARSSAGGGDAPRETRRAVSPRWPSDPGEQSRQSGSDYRRKPAGHEISRRRDLRRHDQRRGRSWRSKAPSRPGQQPWPISSEWWVKHSLDGPVPNNGWSGSPKSIRRSSSVCPWPSS